MTCFLSARDIRREWLLIDATSVVLGRLAAYLVILLKGKHKTCYTPSLDCGDKVIIINASKVSLTGKKLTDKVYYRHTGYPGGIKACTPYDILMGPDPSRLVTLAVKRMLGYGPMSRKRLGNLYVYSGHEHKNEAQKPRVVDFINMNRKNGSGLLWE